jgi:hypothetical protein
MLRLRCQGQAWKAEGRGGRETPRDLGGEPDKTLINGPAPQKSVVLCQALVAAEPLSLMGHKDGESGMGEDIPACSAEDEFAPAVTRQSARDNRGGSLPAITAVAVRDASTSTSGEEG